MYGHNVSHSKRRTRRIFKPNLHASRVEINGVMKRMKLCAKCMRLFKGKSTVKFKAQKSKVKIENKTADIVEAPAFSVQA